MVEMTPTPHVIAVDWSGRQRVRDQRNHIWLCEVVDGEVVRLEAGRTRDEVVDHLLECAESAPNLIVGLDFAFSVPEWYFHEPSLIPSARALWSLVAANRLTPRME